jgi:WD repeat-containing protein 26
MVPAHRLVTLLQQAKDFQIRQCLYHLRFADGPHSLLIDHSCDSNAFPSATIKVLTGHKDEVWDIKFSHDGTKLASSSKDSSVIIWDTEAHIPRPNWADVSDVGTAACVSRSHRWCSVDRLVPGR